MSEFGDGISVGLMLGVLLGILLDRAVIPVSERFGDMLTLRRLRRGRHGR